MCTSCSNINPVSIVVVDDDEITLQCFARLLRGLDCSLLTFTSPLDCLAALVRQQPQLLFVDMEMPRMNGMEFLTELVAHADLNCCHIHLCSAVLPSTEIRRKAKAMGVDAVCKDSVMDKEWLRIAIRRFE